MNTEFMLDPEAIRLVGLGFMAATIYLAFKFQRSFWASLGVWTALMILIDTAATMSFFGRYGGIGMGNAGLISLLLGYGAVGALLHNLVIFGVIRGFLTVIKQAYWKQNS